MLHNSSQPLRMPASQLSPELNLSSLFYYPTMPTVSYVTGNVAQQMKSLVMSALPHFLCNYIWPLLRDSVVWATVAWIRHSESVGMVMLTEACMLRKCVYSWEDKTPYPTWWDVFSMINLPKGRWLVLPADIGLYFWQFGHSTVVVLIRWYCWTTCSLHFWSIHPYDHWVKTKSS